MAPVGEKLDTENKYSDMNGDSSDKSLWYLNIFSLLNNTNQTKSWTVVFIHDNCWIKTVLDFTVPTLWFLLLVV